MKNLMELKEFFKLKEVERWGIVRNRKESAAEHTWACMVLAQYFLPKVKRKLDELKVMKMLLYHDVVEIEAGDIFVQHTEQRKHKKEKEQKAFQKLKKKLPTEMTQEIEHLWNEYEERQTPEAKFCDAIDKLEPMIHWLDMKPCWKKHGFDEKGLREKKEYAMKEFPALHKFFNELIEHLRKEKYF